MSKASRARKAAEHGERSGEEATEAETTEAAPEESILDVINPEAVVVEDGPESPE